MNLGDWKADLKTLAKRGDTMDANIVIAVRHAHLWMERNYSFKYMERFVSFTLDPDMDQPRAVAFPTGSIKSVQFVQRVADDGEIFNIHQVSPKDLTVVEEDVPTGYWIDGMEYLWFDNTPAEAYNMQMGYYRMTDWSAMTDSSETWLMKWGEDCLLWRAGIHLAPFMRDQGFAAMCGQNFVESLKTVIQMDEELKETNRSEVMGYR